ncbi:hypothetical protein [Mesorhizobium sp. M1A.F.Ca.ET.072.01.1.1]|uniref:hypothetical protein n=1 Tax=Mesorhizobium sp. M1A.F.Ca.ET.072.01.1.1 TaxID=2496753 RepID=UPI001FE18641|nr:hypothetical protein [Mesorhizobium sp. M1A.F.Ca.ET.072.01.1.1]
MFGADIGAALIQYLVELAQRFDDRGAAGNARRQFGENLLQLGLALALVLIVLLELIDSF